MIDELLTAINQYVDDAGNGLTTVVTGGFHLRLAPSSLSKYCIIDPIDDAASHAYGLPAGVAFTEPHIQFSAWDASPEDAMVLIKSVIAALDSFPGATRTMGIVAMPDSPEPNETGADGFGWMTTYKFTTT